MAYATEGTPVVMAGNNDNYGMNGLLPLILGGALFGGNGMNGLFGGNRGGYGYGMGNYGVGGPVPGYGVGCGYGYGNGGSLGGYVVGSQEGGQTAGITALQGQVTALAATVNANQIADQMADMQAGISSTIAGVGDTLNNTTRDILSGQGQIRNDITNGNFQTLNSINGLGRDVTAQANNNALQQLNSFNVLGTNINQGFNALNNTTQQGFNTLGNATQQGFNNLGQNVMQGFNSQAFNSQTQTNLINSTLQQGFNEVSRDSNIQTQQIIAGQSAIATQISECCCEIKGAIHTDGEATRALINEIRLAELNAALTDAKVQVSNLQQTNVLNANNAAQTSVILQHISPILASLQNQQNQQHHH